MRHHHSDDHGGASSPWDAAGRERPIFLDEAGRRHRLLRPFGLLAVLGASSWVVALLLGATGFASLAPLPGAVAGRPLAHVSAPARRHAHGPAHLHTRFVAERTRLRPAAETGAHAEGIPASDRS
jgi:hypothetical protein